MLDGGLISLVPFGHRLLKFDMPADKRSAMISAAATLSATTAPVASAAVATWRSLMPTPTPSTMLGTFAMVRTSFACMSRTPLSERLASRCGKAVRKTARSQTGSEGLRLFARADQVRPPVVYGEGGVQLGHVRLPRDVARAVVPDVRQPFGELGARREHARGDGLQHASVILLRIGANHRVDGELGRDVRDQVVAGERDQCGRA